MPKTLPVALLVLSVIVFCPIAQPPAATAAEPGELSESSITSYLEKKSVGDTGSCLVDKAVIEIKGISDLIPGHQTEVFYTYQYTLRCNRGTESKDGQGVLRAARLRNGNWIDRETFAIIPP